MKNTLTYEKIPRHHAQREFRKAFNKAKKCKKRPHQIRKNKKDEARGGRPRPELNTRSSCLVQTYTSIKTQQHPVVLLRTLLLLWLYHTENRVRRIPRTYHVSTLYLICT